MPADTRESPAVPAPTEPDSLPPQLAVDAHSPFSGCRTALYILCGLILIGVVLPFDPLLTRWMPMLAKDGTVLDEVLAMSEYLVEWWVFVALGLVLLMDSRWKHVLVGYGVALGGCAASLHLIKFIVGRARPEKQLGPLSFHLFGDPRQGFDSFPSGHAASAALLAALLALYWPRSRWVSLPAAVLVGASRVAFERHFTTDVLGGAGLALLVVYLCIHILGREYYPRCIIG